MSLVSQAVLLVVRNALDGQTWAEGRVYEQPIDPLTEALGGNKSGRPACAVYVEQAVGEPIGLETQRGKQELTLKVIAYLPPSITIIEDGGVEVRIENTGAGLVLNILGRQIDTALRVGNDVWTALWRKFVVSVTKRKTRFILIEVADDFRVPCAELELSIETVPEPELGAQLFGGWLDLDTALRAQGNEGTGVANLLKTAIENPTGLPDWEQFQATTGLSDAAFAATGLAPLAVDDEGEAVTFSDVTSSPDVEVSVPLEDD